MSEDHIIILALAVAVLLVVILLLIRWKQQNRGEEEEFPPEREEELPALTFSENLVPVVSESAAEAGNVTVVFHAPERKGIRRCPYCQCEHAPSAIRCVICGSRL